MNHYTVAVTLMHSRILTRTVSYPPDVTMENIAKHLKAEALMHHRKALVKFDLTRKNYPRAV